MSTKEPQAVAPEMQTPLQKLNAFGDRHAKIIILLSTILVIVIVALVAKILYERTAAVRASREMAEAHTVEKLKELKVKYADSPIQAEIIYRLGNLYNEQGELEKARDEYEDFRNRFPNHPLKSPFVDRAWSQVVSNIEYLENKKTALLKIPTLQTHPELEAADKRQVEDYVNNLAEKENGGGIPTLLVGPEKVPNPLIRVNLEKKGSFLIELFENETPNATYHLVKQVEAAALDGLKVGKNGDALLFGKKAEFLLPIEESDEEAKKFSVILRKNKDKSGLAAGSFEILLRPLPKLEDAIVIGIVTEGMGILGQVTAEDTIGKATVESKRKTPYEPKTIPGKPEK